MIPTTRRFLQTALLLTATLILGACASGPPKPIVDFKPGYDFSSVEKVAFYRDSGDVVGDNPLQLSDIQRGRIDEALVFALKNKGFEMVKEPEDADLLISWHLVTQHKTDVQTWNTPTAGYYGFYGPYNRYSRYNCWSCVQMQTDVTVRNYTDGTFIVDLIDPEMGKSVWRGTTHSRLKKEPSTDQADYNEAATVIFASFPPGTGQNSPD
tara:strand:+ start:39594 stop:40223 length:630 start_codon:yes stop_codon:yes gene_type:complete